MLTDDFLVEQGWRMVPIVEGDTYLIQNTTGVFNVLYIFTEDGSKPTKTPHELEPGDYLKFTATAELLQMKCEVGSSKVTVTKQ